MNDARTLYRALLQAWNDRDAARFAAGFDREAVVIGFDGSQIRGRDAIESAMGAIFNDHATGAYVGIVRGVRSVGEVEVLQAVSGVVPAGSDELNPALNAVQTLVSHNGRIVLYQNTPAQFHGRPEAAQALTEQLRATLG